MLRVSWEALFVEVIHELYFVYHLIFTFMRTDIPLYKEKVSDTNLSPLRTNEICLHVRRQRLLQILQLFHLRSTSRIHHHLFTTLICTYRISTNSVCLSFGRSPTSSIGMFMFNWYIVSVIITHAHGQFQGVCYFFIMISKDLWMRGNSPTYSRSWNPLRPCLDESLLKQNFACWRIFQLSTSIIINILLGRACK